MSSLAQTADGTPAEQIQTAPDCRKISICPQIWERCKQFAHQDVNGSSEHEVEHWIIRDEREKQLGLSIRRA